MALNAIEWMATILSVIVLVKFLFLAFKPKAWKNFAMLIIDNIAVAKYVYLALGLVGGYYFLQYFDIVVLMAGALPFAFLYGYTMMSQEKFMKGYLNTVFKQGNFISGFWLAWIIWGGASLWALWTIFGQ